MGKVVCLVIITFFTGVRSQPPVITISSDSSGTYVYADGGVVCQLDQNRYLRFRSNTNNDHWIGEKNKPADIGWGYQDIPGYQSTDVQNNISAGEFDLTLTGRKEIADADIVTSIKGVWNAETEHFDYYLIANLDADLEKWYQNSKWAIAAYNKDPQSRCQIEPIDYHIERISVMDRVYADNRNPDLYDCFVLSDNGTDWARVPKLNVFYQIYQDDWLFRWDRPANSYFGFLDPNEGGWISRLEECSGQSRVEICWCWFDIHFVINDGVPPRYSSQRFQANYKLKFSKLTPAQSSSIMRSAEELPWKTMINYRRPVFSHINNFRELINGYESQWAWFSNSKDCLWDNATGYDDNFSVSINKQTAGINAWYGWFYGYPFEKEAFDEEKEYCIRAKVKTEDVKGSVRLTAIKVPTGANPIYTSDNPKWQPEWDVVCSKCLTGDNDWTDLFVYFKTRNGGNQTIITLELDGTGKCWFDNVVITSKPDMNADAEVNYDDFVKFAAEWNQCSVIMN